MALKIREIEEKLSTITDPNDPWVQELKTDDRKGVQNLLNRWLKRINLMNQELSRVEEMKAYEREIHSQGFNLIAGIDEVGRGPLAGPVVAAAVILPEDFKVLGINDSKQISAKKRQELYDQIYEKAIAVGIGVVEAEEIDELNILEATKKAMNIAVASLNPFPDYLLLDAMEIMTPLPQKKLIKGDQKSISIASASIIAKVYRDKLMKKYGEMYPQYNFEKNSGYGTKEHLAALKEYGPTPIHRKSFSPIKEMFEEKQEVQLNLDL